MQSQLGPYTLLELLGDGGMGVVHRARHRELDRFVALKLLRSDGDASVDQFARRRFLREMQTALAVIHPNLVRILDGGTIDGVDYIAMELVDGVTFEDLARREAPMPWARACTLVRDLALGLEALHSAEILHRDVKPANVMLTASGVVKLLDFGLARHHGATLLTAEGECVGTVSYLAPEVISGGDHSVSSDLWALGCVFYRLLTGRHPFAGESLSEFFKQVMESEINPPRSLIADIPDAVSSISTALLSKDPGNRGGSAAAVALRLEGRLERDRRGAALPLKPAQPNAVARAFGGLLLCGLLGLGLAFYRGRTSPSLPSPAQPGKARQIRPDLRPGDIRDELIAIEQHREWILDMWTRKTQLSRDAEARLPTWKSLIAAADRDLMRTRVVLEKLEAQNPHDLMDVRNFEVARICSLLMCFNMKVYAGLLRQFESLATTLSNQKKSLFKINERLELSFPEDSFEIDSSAVEFLRRLRIVGNDSLITLARHPEWNWSLVGVLLHQVLDISRVMSGVHKLSPELKVMMRGTPDVLVRNLSGVPPAGNALERAILAVWALDQQRASRGTVRTARAAVLALGQSAPGASRQLEEFCNWLDRRYGK